MPDFVMCPRRILGFVHIKKEGAAAPSQSSKTVFRHSEQPPAKPAAATLL